MFAPGTPRAAWNVWSVLQSSCSLFGPPWGDACAATTVDDTESSSVALTGYGTVIASGTKITRDDTITATQSSKARVVCFVPTTTLVLATSQLLKVSRWTEIKARGGATIFPVHKRRERQHAGRDALPKGVRDGDGNHPAQRQSDVDFGRRHGPRGVAPHQHERLFDIPPRRGPGARKAASRRDARPHERRGHHRRNDERETAKSSKIKSRDWPHRCPQCSSGSSRPSRTPLRIPRDSRGGRLSLRDGSRSS